MNCPNYGAITIKECLRLQNKEFVCSQRFNNWMVRGFLSFLVVTVLYFSSIATNGFPLYLFRQTEIGTQWTVNLGYHEMVDHTHEFNLCLQ